MYIGRYAILLLVVLISITLIKLFKLVYVQQGPITMHSVLMCHWNSIRTTCTCFTTISLFAAHA